MASVNNHNSFGAAQPLLIKTLHKHTSANTTSEVGRKS